MFKKRIPQKISAICIAAALIVFFCVPAAAVYYNKTWTNALQRGFMDLVEQSTTPGTPGAGAGRWYVRDISGDMTLCFKDDAGTEATLNYQTSTVQLPLLGFITTNVDPILSATSAPGVEVDDYIPNLVWADGETTPAMVSFRVPVDYSSGGAFKILATESNSTTPNQIDFDVYVNGDNQAIDASATNQTPVALAGTTATPNEVTLSVTTDFAALSAGKWITLRVWRDDVADGTGDLEVKGVAFYYLAKDTQ